MTPKAKKWVSLATGCLVLFTFAITIYSFLLEPLIGGVEARLAEVEIKSTVNPDDLKAWGRALLKKYPDDDLSFSPELTNALPSYVPRFHQAPVIVMQHSPEGGRVYIGWRFGSPGLRLTMDFGKPEEWSGGGTQWKPGMYFNHTN